jgi:hypothetical protein
MSENEKWFESLDKLQDSIDETDCLIKALSELIRLESGQSYIKKDGEYVCI